jgi:phosphoribosyl-ATP pyrophosphohydrolase
MLMQGRISYAPRMFARPHSNYIKRKLIEFAPEIWLALEMLAKDTGRSVQELADEAFGDLLGKYQRPASLKDALRESARRLPANDDAPPGR